MIEETALDRAHAAMQAAPESDAARLGFYERLADSELFLMLAEDPSASDDQVTPEIFELNDASYVLVFDREERMVAFSGDVTPYVALSGRVIASMLVGQGIGLGVNLQVAPSSILLPPDATDWLHTTLRHTPDEIEARIEELKPPHGLPEQLLSALDTKLATAMGLARAAYLVEVAYSGGGRGHLLGFVGAMPQAQSALAQAASETLTFSGIEAGSMDVAFFREADPIVAALDRHGLRFDLPQMQQPAPTERSAPGSDPLKPPKLK